MCLVRSLSQITAAPKEEVQIEAVPMPGELALKGGVQTQSHFMYLRMYAAGCKIFKGVQWTRASRCISEVLSENFAPDSFWRPRGGSDGLRFWRRGPHRLAASAVPKRRREALNMRFILFPALCQLEGLQRLRFVHQLQRPQAQKEARLHGDSPEEETEEERKRGACVGLDKC